VQVQRRSAAALAAIALLAPALAACGPGGLLGTTAKGSQSLDATVAPGTTLTLRVDMFNGSIVVRAGPAGAIHADVETTGVGDSAADAEADRQRIQTTLTTNPDGSALLRSVYQPNPNAPSRRSASAVVEVPADAALDLRTSNGQVSVAGVGGAISVRTTNGPVDLAGLAGGAMVRTTNGPVRADGTGTIDIQTTNGPVAVSGDGPTLTVRTSNGAISFSGTFSAATQRLTTTNAAITVEVPADAGFTLDARTTNAEVDLGGLPFQGTGSSSTVAKQGIVGPGGPAWLILRTSNGAISLGSP